MLATQNKTNAYKKIAISFFALSGIIALMIFYVAFSWATITITPKSESFTSSFTTEVNPTGDTSIGSIKGIVKEVTMTAEGTFSASGTEEQSQRVTGTITLINSNPTAQPLRATTRLQNAEGILFRLKDYVNIPPKGQIDAEVYADQEGDIGEIKSTKFIFPGLNPASQDLIYGQGFIPSTGGKKDIKIVTKQDIENAEKKLVEGLQAKAKGEAANDVFSIGAQKAVTLTKASNITSRSSVSAGKTADQFTLSVSAKIGIVTFDESDLAVEANKKFKERLAPTQELIAPNPSDFSLSIDKLDATAKVATIKAGGQARKVVARDADIFDKKRLMGKNKAQIMEYFKAYEDIESVEVRLYPFWVINAPYLSDHVNILIKK